MNRVRALTSSAHDRVELVRAMRAGVRLVFLSPVFATASHPGADWLGAARWAALAGASTMDVAALGGITAATVRGLHRDRCVAMGAIDALVA
jgi:thiamine-phosphate pyrophosphorylase